MSAHSVLGTGLGEDGEGELTAPAPRSLGTTHVISESSGLILEMIYKGVGKYTSSGEESTSGYWQCRLL